MALAIGVNNIERARNVVDNLRGNSTDATALGRISDRFVAHVGDDFIQQRYATDPASMTNDQKADLLLFVMSRAGRAVMRSVDEAVARVAAQADIAAAGDTAEADLDEE